jgi:hypothetical protein
MQINRSLLSTAFLVLAVSLGGCGEDSKGPIGPTGPVGAPGPASETRIVRVNCTTQSCQAQCEMSEVLVTAYCGPSRHAATFLSENSASCGLTPSNAESPLTAICVRARDR